MTEKQASVLQAHNERRNHDTIERVNRAIDNLKKCGAVINFETVAKEAGVSRATLYNNLALKERIIGLRAVARCPAAEIKKQKPKEAVSALRARVRKLEEDKKNLIAQLVDYEETKAENKRLRRQLSKWVLSEMKELNIRRIQRVYDYLEEQIHKQYEYDIANGANTLRSLDELSLRYSKPSESVHKDSLESKHQRKKRSFFGDLGRAKKIPQALKEIRDEVTQVFFDSGKYRLTHKCFCGTESVAHCHLELGLVFQSKEDFENLTPENLFDLLHEVGHLETNTEGMTRQEEEYFATEWALQRMKLYDFRLPKTRQKQFDDYINGYSSRRNKVLGKDGAPKLNWDE